MNIPNIKIDKSRIPIVWLDTSIIVYLTRFRKEPEKLDDTQRFRIKRLAEQLDEYGNDGRIICPLAEQEGEIWADRSDWMDTIQTISLGIECVSLKEIQDRQLCKAMKAYVDGDSVITLSYLDAFDRDPIDELNEVLQQQLFIAMDQGIFMGADYRRDLSIQLVANLNEQRARNVSSCVTFESQLTSEIEEQIEKIAKMASEIENGIVRNEHDEFNKMGAWINLHTQLLTWEHLTGKPNDLGGLVEFHKSTYNINCPFVDLQCNLYAKIMIDPQPIRTGDPMDINHISTLMPFSDLFITDKAWSSFLNNQSYNEKYRTTICYIGDTDRIDDFFDNIA